MNTSKHLLYFLLDLLAGLSCVRHFFYRNIIWIRYLFGGKTPLVENQKFGIWTMAKLLLLAFCFIIFFGKPSFSKEEKVFEGWVLHLYLSDSQLKEYTPRESMAVCLQVKRKILRKNKRKTGTRWECAQGKIILRKFDDRWLPVKHLGKQ